MARPLSSSIVPLFFSCIGWGQCGTERSGWMNFSFPFLPFPYPSLSLYHVRDWEWNGQGRDDMGRKGMCVLCLSVTPPISSLRNYRVWHGETNNLPFSLFFPLPGEEARQGKEREKGERNRRWGAKEWAKGLISPSHLPISPFSLSSIPFSLLFSSPFHSLAVIVDEPERGEMEWRDGRYREKRKEGREWMERKDGLIGHFIRFSHPSLSSPSFDLMSWT